MTLLDLVREDELVQCTGPTPSSCSALNRADSILILIPSDHLIPFRERDRAVLGSNRNETYFPYASAIDTIPTRRSNSTP